MAAPEALSRGQQMAAMRAAWPDLRVLLDGRCGVIWQGPLAGFDRIYEVQVALWTGADLGGCELEHHGPETYVLRPDIAAESGGLARLPHVYRSPLHPKLCLYDPDAGEWGWHMPLATTIVPWAAQWLAFYELWRVTGRWTGPERHPSPQVHEADPGALPFAAARPSERQLRREADRWGTEASKPLLWAAAAGGAPLHSYEWHSHYLNGGPLSRLLAGGTA